MTGRAGGRWAGGSRGTRWLRDRVALVAVIVVAATFALPVRAAEARAAEVQGVGHQGDPVRVRHDVAQPGEPVVTLRWFRIRKGSYPEFLRASQEGVWPFFEKIGARVVGMWLQVPPPAGDGGAVPPGDGDSDEVWLLTRYASAAHWRATRDMAALGGDGPDYRAAIAALKLRDGLTLETKVRFLSGEPWTNPPFYLPAVE